MLVTTALSAASRTVLCASGGEDWQSERGVPIKTNGAVNNAAYVKKGPTKKPTPVGFFASAGRQRVGDWPTTPTVRGFTRSRYLG